jgi:hypothetical protein
MLVDEFGAIRGGADAEVIPPKHREVGTHAIVWVRFRTENGEWGSWRKKAAHGENRAVVCEADIRTARHSDVGDAGQHAALRWVEENLGFAPSPGRWHSFHP